MIHKVIYFVVLVFSSVAMVVYSILNLASCSAGKKTKQPGQSLPGELQKHRSMWSGRYQNIPLKFYGGGCNQAFSVYLEGDSQVSVANVDELADWLLTCKYLSDLEHKGVRDHWQHPNEFEHSRTGDCEDFALWTWRKLIELGIQCEFMVGKWVRNGRAGTHAWVLFYENDKPVIFETTGVSKQRMFKPLDSAIAEYIPFAAIDHNVKKKVYIGITAWFMKLVNQQ